MTVVRMHICNRTHVFGVIVERSAFKDSRRIYVVSKCTKYSIYSSVVAYDNTD